MSPTSENAAAFGELLSFAQVCREFGKSARTLERWVERGQFAPCIQLGAVRYWRRSAIINWIAAHETPSGKRAPARRRRSKQAAS